MHPHLSADVGQELQIALVELDPEPGIREVFDDGAFDLDALLFLGLDFSWFFLKIASGHRG